MILRGCPHDPAALVEKGLLELDSDRPAEARRSFERVAERWRGSPLALAGLGRSEREQVRKAARAFDPKALEDVLEGAHLLRDLGPSAYAPVIHLQESRAILAFEGSENGSKKGEMRLARAARPLERLRAWAAKQPRGGGDFAGWWADRVAEQALDGKAQQSEIAAEDVEVLDAWQQERTAELDGLEEDFCLRQAALSSMPKVPKTS